jgi:homoserine dehydrogenase
MVAARNIERARAVVGDACEIVSDPFAVVNNPDIDIVVELIGGYELSRELVLQAIANGKHVVTANKACWPCTATRSSPPPRRRA